MSQDLQPSASWRQHWVYGNMQQYPDGGLLRQRWFSYLLAKFLRLLAKFAKRKREFAIAWLLVSDVLWSPVIAFMCELPGS